MDKIHVQRIGVQHEVALTAVRDLIANEENAYSIQDVVWDKATTAPSDSKHGGCDTPACIMGWSQTLNGEDYFHVSHVNTMAGCELFMPERQGPDRRCSYIRTPEWFTRKRTIAMLDHLINTHELDWMALENQNG